MKVFIAIALCALAAVGNAQKFEELVATVNNNPKSSWKQNFQHVLTQRQTQKSYVAG